MVIKNPFSGLTSFLSPINLSNDSAAWEMLSMRNIHHEEAIPEHVRPIVLINDYWKLVTNSTTVNQRRKSSDNTL